MELLSGWKTYIIAALMVVAAGLQAQGYLSVELYGTIQAILTGGGFAALRAAKS